MPTTDPEQIHNFPLSDYDKLSFTSEAETIVLQAGAPAWQTKISE
jgi:hypothetical protein